MSALTPAGATMVTLMGDLPRGPRRDGAFALWLVVRVAEDLLLIPPLPERAVRRRVAALEHRLSSLILPAPLRRALVAALAELSQPASSRDRAGLVLHQLAGPAREVFGPEAGEALSRAARDARADNR